MLSELLNVKAKEKKIKEICFLRIRISLHSYFLKEFFWGENKLPVWRCCVVKKRQDDVFPKVLMQQISFH